MKAVLSWRLYGLVLLAFLLTACNLIPLSPSLTISVQSTPYTSSQIVIPYSFATLSQNSNDGSAECNYVLEMFYPYQGGYQSLDQQQTTLAPSGNLTFDLSSLFQVPTASSAVDGLYRLTFQVLSDQYDQNGSRIPISYLSQTKTFVVNVDQQPEILSTNPVALNVNSATQQSVSLTGVGFSSTMQVFGQLPTQTVQLTSSYKSSQEMTAQVDLSGLSPGPGNPTYNIYATDGQGVTTQTYDIPLIGNVTVTAVYPVVGSTYDTNLPVYIVGTYLGLWSKAEITDSKGASAKVTIDRNSGSYVTGHVDLTGLTAGAATVTVTNPEGSTATYPFTVSN